MNDLAVQLGKAPHYLRLAAETLVVALIYALLGWLGQSLAIPPGNVTAVWPPSGFALAIVLLLNKRAWVGIWLGAFIINTQAFFDSAIMASIAVSLAVGASIALGSLVQPIVGANLIYRFTQSDNSLQTVKKCLVFVGVIPFMCLISSTIGAVSLYFGGFVPGVNLGELWLTWWLGDSVGVLVLAPFIITWSRQKSINLSNFDRLELAVAFSLLVLFSFIGFGNLFGDTESHYPIEFIVWPFLLWLTLRFRSSLAITGMLALCVIAIWHTVQGRGPFQLETPNQSLLVLQLFIFATAVSVMIVASLRNEREAAEQSLRTAHNNLEETVKQRTAELSAEIAERKQVEKELRKSEEKLSLHIQNTPLGCISWDINFKCTEWNKSAQEIFGYAADEAIGLHPSEIIVTAKIKDEINSAYKLLLAQKGGSQNTIESTTKDGRIIICDWYNTPIIDLYGAVTGVASLILDITERKNLEDQLRQAQKMEAVGQLTGGIAHDFNNLLAIMLGNSEMLEDKVADDKDASLQLYNLMKAVDRAASLTDRLLTFSRQQTLSPVNTGVWDLVDGLADMLQRTLGETIDLKVARSSDLWPASIDPHQFENALVNLAINARDAMPNGGMLTIEAANVILDETYAGQNEEVTPGEYVKVAVTDTGIGMTPEVLTKVFEPFYTTKGVGEGSGLGLSMVYGFAKQSNGHVTIYSEEGQGTTVKLYMPRSEKTIEQEDPKSETLVFYQGTECILVVEDDESVREIPVGILRNQGYTIIEAGDGEEAIKQLKSNRFFDLLFTDMMLPGGMNGVEIAEQAKELQPNIKVLYTTGYAENSVINNGMLDPAVALVNKPYRRTELLEKIRATLDRSDD